MLITRIGISGKKRPSIPHSCSKSLRVMQASSRLHPSPPHLLGRCGRILSPSRLLRGRHLHRLKSGMASAAILLMFDGKGKRRANKPVWNWELQQNLCTV